MISFEDTEKKIITIKQYVRYNIVLVRFSHLFGFSVRSLVRSFVFCCSSPVIPSIICDGGERMVLARMIFAERTTAFRVEALALEILFAHRAVEALAVVVIIQGLHPTIASLDWKSTRETFRSEQLVPVSFAVGQSFL